MTGIVGGSLHTRLQQGFTSNDDDAQNLRRNSLVVISQNENERLPKYFLLNYSLYCHFLFLFFLESENLHENLVLGDNSKHPGYT